MIRFSFLVALCLLSFALLARYSVDSVTISFRYGGRKHLSAVESAQARRQAIKVAFSNAWYHHDKQNAMISDLSMPTGEYPDARSIWDGVAIDALSTAIVMELPEIVEGIVYHTLSMDFRNTSVESSLIQSTRTFIGGLLSAHDLLAGPYSGLIDEDEGLAVDLRNQLRDVADSHIIAFDTPSRLPDDVLLLGPDAGSLSSRFTSIEMSGALELEWTRLSHLLENNSYSAVTDAAGRAVIDARAENCHEPFPGLLTNSLDTETGRFVSRSGGFNGEASEYYDNLLKVFLYSPPDNQYKRDRWIRAMDSAIEHLITHPRSDLSLLASFDCTELQYTADLASFSIAGSLILGGASLGMPEYVEHGLSLLESQIKVYRSTATGLGPEKIAWNLIENEEPDRQTNRHKKFATANGFAIVDAKNELRGEIFENLYYAYRVTGLERYRDLSWEVYTALNRSASFEDGCFKGLDDVNAPPHSSITGRIAADWGHLMAKTFKFAYLIHLDEEVWQSHGNKDTTWLFNSRGHLMRTKGGRSRKLSLLQQ